MEKKEGINERYRIFKEIDKLIIGIPYRTAQRIKKLLWVDHPKLALLALLIIFAYYIFENPVVSEWVSQLQSLSYIGMFFAGMFFAFGFSAPFAVGFLLISQPPNIFIATIAGAFGALTSDLLIFKWIKVSFSDEFNNIKKKRAVKNIKKAIQSFLGTKLSTYLFYLIVGIIIASPLPDEIGITMLAGLTTLKPSSLGFFSFFLNGLGIFIILLI